MASSRPVLASLPIAITQLPAQEQIARAVELELGAARPDLIDIVPAADAESRACADTLRTILAAG